MGSFLEKVIHEPNLKRLVGTRKEKKGKKFVWIGSTRKHTVRVNFFLIEEGNKQHDPSSVWCLGSE